MASMLFIKLNVLYFSEVVTEHRSIETRLHAIYTSYLTRNHALLTEETDLSKYVSFRTKLQQGNEHPSTVSSAVNIN